MPKTINISIECDNDAMQSNDGIMYVFEQAGRAIIRDEVELDYQYPLRDLNGNKVGYITATDDTEEGGE